MTLESPETISSALISYNSFHSSRFFVDSIFSLENPAVIEVFFLEAHQQLLKVSSSTSVRHHLLFYGSFVQGQLDLSNIDYVRVGGLLLQIYRGDWSE